MNVYRVYGSNMQDKANPLATILSAAMLLKYGLGEEKAAHRIETAVLDTLNRGFRTGDIYSEGNVCRYCYLFICLFFIFYCGSFTSSHCIGFLLLLFFHPQNTHS